MAPTGRGRQGEDFRRVGDPDLLSRLAARSLNPLPLVGRARVGGTIPPPEGHWCGPHYTPTPNPSPQGGGEQAESLGIVPRHITVPTTPSARHPRLDRGTIETGECGKEQSGCCTASVFWEPFVPDWLAYWIPDQVGDDGTNKQRLLHPLHLSSRTQRSEDPGSVSRNAADSNRAPRSRIKCGMTAERVDSGSAPSLPLDIA